jgi:hypothetical protein
MSGDISISFSIPVILCVIAWRPRCLTRPRDVQIVGTAKIILEAPGITSTGDVTGDVTWMIWDSVLPLFITVVQNTTEREFSWTPSQF